MSCLSFVSYGFVMFVCSSLRFVSVVFPWLLSVRYDMSRFVFKGMMCQGFVCVCFDVSRACCFLGLSEKGLICLGIVSRVCCV